MKREFIETQKGYLAQEQSKLLRGAYESWKIQPIMNYGTFTTITVTTKKRL